ncbi:MAG: IS5 family transposase [Myxococcota bacterium]
MTRPLLGTRDSLPKPRAADRRTSEASASSPEVQNAVPSPKNWPEYERALRARGDVTVWIGEEACNTWTPAPAGNRGGQQIYSDTAIETVLTLRLLFHLPLRATEGFVASIFKLAGLNLGVSTRCGAPHHAFPSLIVDSSGLKICGQGEWHTKKHGQKSRRKWKKLHIGVDDEGWIRTSLVTDGHTQDPRVVPELLEQLDVELKRFVADGVYDSSTVYRAIAEHQPRIPVDVVVPPRRNTAPSRNAATSPTQRDEHIATLLADGLSQWRWESGYYAQSGVENVFSRYKAIFGGHLRAKRQDSQEREAQLGCAILNKQRALGTPLSVRVE